MASQPKSSAMRSAAMYILHWSRICASVSSVSGSAAGAKLHALAVEPGAHLARFVRRW